MFASVLKRTDGVPQGREIGEESPGPFKVRRLFLTALALMIRCVGRGRVRDKWLVAAGTYRMLERADGVPARGAEEGDRVSAE